MNDSHIFKKLVDELINRRLIRNVNELASILPYDQGHLSKLYNGKNAKKLTPTIKLRLHEKFKIRHDFLSTGIEPMFDEIKKDDPQTVTESKNEENPLLSRETAASASEVLNRFNKMLELYILDLRKGQDAIIQGQNAAIENNKFLTKIVDECWKAGALKIDPEVLKKLKINV